MTNLTAEKIRRINEAIEECDRFINIESSRSSELRSKEVSDKLEGYIAHRDYLKSVIALA